MSDDSPIVISSDEDASDDIGATTDVYSPVPIRVGNSPVKVVSTEMHRLASLHCFERICM